MNQNSFVIRLGIYEIMNWIMLVNDYFYIYMWIVSSKLWMLERLDHLGVV